MIASSPRVTIHWCWEGVLYTVVLGFILTGAIFRDFNLLIILAGMMLGPLILSAPLVASGLRSLKLCRSVPESIVAGEPLEVSIALTNQRKRLGAWGVSVVDTGLVEAIRTSRSDAAGKDQDGLALPVLFLPYIAPRATVTGSFTTTIARRGHYKLGSMTLATRMPFGLFRATMSYPTDDQILVFPRLGSLARDWRRHVARHEMEGPQSVSRQGVVDGDYYGLRDWRAGDSRRWIHWRTSARRNQLTVRQFERHTNRDVVVLLDLRCSAYDARRVEQVERMISLTATICADLCRLGNSRLEIGTTGSIPMLLAGAASTGTLREAHRWLAVVELHQRDYLPELLRRASHQRRAPADIVLLLTTQPLSAAQLLEHPYAATSEYQQLVNSLRVVRADDPLVTDMFQLDGAADTTNSAPVPDSSVPTPAAVDIGPSDTAHHPEAVR